MPSNMIIVEKLLEKLKGEDSGGLTDTEIQILERCKEEYGRWFARLLRVAKML